MNHLTRAALALPLLAAGAAYAQPTYTVLVRENDFFPIGNVTTVDTVAVNNSGSWLVDIDTNNPDTTADHYLLRDGAIYLQEGAVLNPPAVGNIGFWDDLTLNNLGNSGWNWFLANTGASNNDSGIFYNDTMIFQEGAISTAAGFTAPTPYTGFFGAKINDSNQIVIVASVDDPSIASTTDRAIVRIDYNAGAGTFTETVIAKEGDILPGAIAAVIEFGTDEQEFAFNNAGDVMYAAEVSGGTSDAFYINGTAVAREGEPSPDAGRNWELLAGGRALDLNNNGGYVFRANLTGDTADDEVLVRNGQIFMREGQNLPAIGSFNLTGFGTSAPLFIDDSNNVLWYGTWNDPVTSQNKGLFLNDQLLIQDGVTVINGELVQGVRGITQGFKMSDNGRHIIVRLQFVSNIDAAVLISFPGPTCGTADFDGDGDTGTDADIEAFFACLAGNCCATCFELGADFNGDGDVGTDADIEAFFRVLAGGEC